MPYLKKKWPSLYLFLGFFNYCVFASAVFVIGHTLALIQNWMSIQSDLRAHYVSNKTNLKAHDEGYAYSFVLGAR